MPANVIVSTSVIERVKNGKEGTKGALFGNITVEHYVLGLYTGDEFEQVQLMLPADVDLCGAFQIGTLDIDEVNRILKDVDVTDNPIILSVPEPCTIIAYNVINNKLVQSPMVIVNEQEIYSQFIHVRLNALVPFTSDLEVDAVSDELLRIRKQFSSGRIAFQCPDENVYLLGTSENMVCGENPTINEEMTVGNMREISGGPIPEVAYSRSNRLLNLDVLPVVVFKRATFDSSDTEIQHAPVIQLNQCETRLLQLLINLDAMSLVHKNTSLGKLYTILVDSACRNLRLIGNAVLSTVANYEEDEFPLGFKLDILHFFSSKYGHFVTRVLDGNVDDDEPFRMMLHNGFLINKHRPYFKRANQFLFRNGDIDEKSTSIITRPSMSSLLNSVKPPGSSGEEALVDGDFEYYHYCQDGMDDDGWGCAYRSLQTIASWLRFHGFADKAVPTHKEIQQCLFDIGDKPSNFVGSRQWIGSTEVGYVLDTMYKIPSKIIYVSSGDELSTKGPELVYHFKKYGSPIMIGGGVLAHTIIGVNYNRDLGTLKFLILDPHYKGKEDIKTIISKGWCGWKDEKFWDKKSYYNMCLPITDNCI